MRSWAAPVNCPHFSGTEQAVQTSPATSPGREEPQRSAIYRKTPRPQETGDGRCEPGERVVTDMWLKQRKQREGEESTCSHVPFHAPVVCFPETFAKKEHTHTHMFVQQFLSGYLCLFIVDILTLIITNSCQTRTLIWPHFPHDSQLQQRLPLWKCFLI